MITKSILMRPNILAADFAQSGITGKGIAVISEFKAGHVSDYRNSPGRPISNLSCGEPRRAPRTAQAIISLANCIAFVKR